MKSAQYRALLTLVYRSFTRAKLPGRRAEHASSGVVLRALLLFAMFAQGQSVGRIFVEGEAAAFEATWLVFGLFGVALSTGAALAFPAVRGISPVMRHAFLDALPLAEGTRTTFELLFAYGLHLFVVTAGAVAAGPAGAVAALVLSVGAAAVGNGAVRLLRCALPARRLASLAWIINVGLLGGYLMAALKGVLARRTADIVPSLQIVGATWLGGRGWVLATPILFLGVGFLILAERIGYDRMDLVAPKAVREVPRETLRMGAIDALLAQREPGGRVQRLIGPIVVTAITAGFAGFWIWVLRHTDSNESYEWFKDPQGFGISVGILHMYLAFIFVAGALGLSMRASSRDLAARPLLAPLPIAPRDLLGGRLAFVRRRSLATAAPLLIVLVVFVSWPAWISAAWHTAYLLAATWFVADAAVCVAFLSSGVGSGQRARWQLANYLLYFPLASITLADRFWRAILPLAFLALIAREARRAALGVVRWQDDDAEFSPNTAVWRALVVFGAFAGVQGLVLRVVTSAWASATVTQVSLVAYMVSAALLVALTSAGRGVADLWSQPFRVELGFLGGVASLGIALGYRAFLVHVGVDADPLAMRNALATVALAVVAPVAEEIFFRGWLQTALVDRDSNKGLWRAVGFQALLFSLVHPIESFPAVFVLGLIAGVLRQRTGGVTAGIVAHGIHNAGVVWL